MPRPVERADAEAIAGQQQLLLAFVPQRDGELAAQLLEDAFAVIFIKMRDQFGVAMGAEVVPLRFELGLDFGIIEQFAVEDDGDGAVFIGDRLLAVREADDLSRRLARPRPGRKK